MGYGTLQFGDLNIALGWAFMAFGIATGALIGMYAFSGPFPAPNSHQEYTALPRRLVRLGHIACIALPMISILYGSYIDQAALSPGMKWFGSRSMLVGMFGVPLLLFAASVYLPFKYAEVIPVSCVLSALIIIAYGFWI